MNKDGKRPRPDKPSQPTSKKKFYNQDSSIGSNDKVCNNNSQGGGYAFEMSRCTTCGKQHLGRSLAGMDGFFGYVNRFHTMRDWMVLKAICKETNQANHDGLDPNASKRNCFYALRARK
ncbi:hypothetical protein EJD97_021941 [Solanum chilense]|uniref:Uncharacterized protein n=1 Tax=Solanum chilense TaxID=4083 RepID=A0A6N2CL11_SOLCI|nr:hypothetical protein EJD97_021941 [Solanum chilense]